ncbi:hypothetical protein K501DRAFT_266990 [Backusella circina FSU 941]|nr:hypothetical protein K501DRAFT_266990 [Backusella circina FSU 941]
MFPLHISLCNSINVGSSIIPLRLKLWIKKKKPYGNDNRKSGQDGGFLCSTPFKIERQLRVEKLKLGPVYRRDRLSISLHRTLESCPSTLKLLLFEYIRSVDTSNYSAPSNNKHTAYHFSKVKCLEIYGSNTLEENLENIWIASLKNRSLCAVLEKDTCIISEKEFLCTHLNHFIRLSLIKRNFEGVTNHDESIDQHSPQPTSATKEIILFVFNEKPQQELRVITNGPPPSINVLVSSKSMYGGFGHSFGFGDSKAAPSPFTVYNSGTKTISSFSFFAQGAALSFASAAPSTEILHLVQVFIMKSMLKRYRFIILYYSEFWRDSNGIITWPEKCTSCYFEHEVFSWDEVVHYAGKLVIGNRGKREWNNQDELKLSDADKAQELKIFMVMCIPKLASDVDITLDSNPETFCKMCLFEMIKLILVTFDLDLQTGF